MLPVSRDVNDKEVQKRLQQLAQEVMSEITELDSDHGKELLGAFVSELFLAVAKQEQQDFRRQKQAEGIAAARARGVQFGRTRKPLPDNFSECYEAWQSGHMTQTQAAESCGISRATFRREINRLKRDNSCSV